MELTHLVLVLKHLLMKIYGPELRTRVRTSSHLFFLIGYFRHMGGLPSSLN